MTVSADSHSEIAISLYTEVSKMSKRLQRMELPPGFTPARLRTLATICASGPLSVTALAALEKVQPATVSRMVAALEDDGLIKRRENKSDKRSVRLTATAKGRQMYQRANRLYLQRLTAAVATLEPEQIELMRSLASLLEQLNAALRD